MINSSYLKKWNYYQKDCENVKNVYNFYQS